MSQTLVHYPPSYALEVLCELDGVASFVANFEHQLSDKNCHLVGSHDALYDSVRTLGLFHYLVDRLSLLESHYPGL